MLASSPAPSLNVQTPSIANPLLGGALHDAHLFLVVLVDPDAQVTCDEPSLKPAPIALDGPVATLIVLVVVEVDLNVNVSAAAAPATAQSSNPDANASFIMHPPDAEGGAKLHRYVRACA